MFVIISLFWGHNKLCPAAFRWVADSASCTPGLLYHHSTSLIPSGFFFKRQSVLPMVFHHCQPLLLSYASGRHKWHPFFLTLGIKRVKNPTCTTIHQWLDLKRSHFHRLVLGRFHCLPWPELPDKAQVVTGGGATLFHSTILPYAVLPHYRITKLSHWHIFSILVSQWWISVLHCASISNRCTRMYHQVVVGGYTRPQYQVVTLHKILQRSQEVIAHFKTPTRWTFCVDPVQQFE